MPHKICDFAGAPVFNLSGRAKLVRSKVFPRENTCTPHSRRRFAHGMLRKISSNIRRILFFYSFFPYINKSHLSMPL